MGVRKYKYYFKKPKSEIVKDILYWLLTAGAVTIAASSPYFVPSLFKYFKKGRKYNKKKIYNTFYRLQKERCLEIQRRDNQIYIYLTEKGKRKAGWLQIDSLEIRRPNRWDGKWRIVMFDIAQLRKIYREAFRGKLKELGFLSLQKSVWVYPFECHAEIELLRDFFGLSDKEIRLIVAEDIGKDDFLKKAFKV